jgi:hypothetical protein
MTCNDVRNRLTAKATGVPVADFDTAVEHLRDCPACVEYARRLAVASGYLRDHHAGIEPDVAFATRVVAALPKSPGLVGRAALKLLPAALALVIVLAGWCLIDTSSPEALLDEAPTDDLLGWVLQAEGDRS